MKKIVIFLSLFFVATSCVTQRKCLQKFPPKETRDSVYIETVVHDTIPMPADTTIADFPVYNCPDQKLFQMENDRLKLTISILNGRIKAVAIIKPQINVVTHTDTYTRLRAVRIPTPVKFIPKIYKDALWICIILFSSGFIWFGWKAYKFFKK
jgi:hypothetical protein